jgi:hypothetical protein
MEAQAQRAIQEQAGANAQATLRARCEQMLQALRATDSCASDAGE